MRDGELLAQPLDIDAGTLTGEVATIASDVRVEESQRGLLASVSTTGTLVWASARAGNLTFAWYDRSGRRLDALPIAPGKIMQPRIAPDGARLAFTRAAGGTADIWIHDLQTGATTQVTTHPDYDENPEWMPDGRALGHSGDSGKGSGLIITVLDGSQPQRVVISAAQASIGQFMPDGRHLLFSRVSSLGGDREIAVVDVNRPDVMTGLTTDSGTEGQSAPSPDGKWLAFVTDRTGRPEVVLTRLVDDGQSLRVTDQRLPVSSSGGIDPHWRADGRELLYSAPDRTIMAVSVSITGNAVTLGKPVPLFRVLADAGGWGANWTANHDHTRFLVVEAPHEAGQTFRLLTRWE